MLAHQSRRSFISSLTLATSTLALSPYTKALASLAPTPNIFNWDTIAPGFHALIDLNTGGNALILSSQNQSLLIDTKFAHLANALHTDLTSLTQKDSSLSLINTHHHGDHTGGNPLIIPHTTHSYAQTNAHQRIADQLERFKQAAKSGPSNIKRLKDSTNDQDALLKHAIQAANKADSWTTDSITPSHKVDQTKSITIGDTPLTMHHFGPAHTDNDLIIHFEDHNIIHTGDLVFAGLHPFFDPSAGVTVKGWINALNQILKLCDDQTTIIPGHGPIGTKQTIQSQLDYLEQLVSHVQKAITSGQSKAETAKQEWDFMNDLGFNSIRPRAIEATYDELQG